MRAATAPSAVLSAAPPPAASSESRPPGSRAPAVLQTVPFVFGDPVAHIESLYRRYGGVFGMHLLAPAGGDVRTYSRRLRPRRVLCCASPASIEELLVHKAQHFSSDALGRIFGPLMGPSSLFNLDGTRHGEHRRMVAPALSAGRALRMLTDAEDGIADRIERLPQATSVAFLGWSQRLCLSFMLPYLFGPVPARVLRALERSTLDLMGRLSHRRLFLPIRDRGIGAAGRLSKADRTLRTLRTFIGQQLRDAPAHASPGSLIDVIRRGRGPDGLPLSAEEMEDAVMTFLITGYQSPSGAIAWTAYWLARDPDLQEALYEEVRAATPEDPETSARFPLLDAVCKESLRITPPVVLTVRTATTATTIAGHPIAAGDCALASIFLLHRRPDLYPDPLRFDPSRFLGRAPGRYEYMPHSVGPRTCPGAALSGVVLRRVIRRLVEHQRLEVDPLSPVRQGCRHVSLVPQGLRLLFSAR